ncbi:hypothetical protein ACVCIH_09595 [Burkholderia glumae]|uniref:hypothetical protein n=1 Tax=Burkholderia glumae TaxID=337 RepID=UPI0020369A9E|nr:hypothetical protein [Burkholderia glumae]MCM2493053.1 hypothetical protein [Burkholderia glumae]
MAKRDLTPEYRAGAEAFAALFNGFRHGPECVDFLQVTAAMADAKGGKSAEFCSGFDEAVGVVIEQAATGTVKEDWNPMRDLEHPDWWREDEPEGGAGDKD